MKRFLVRVIVFVGIVYLLAVGLDSLLCKGLLKMEDYRFQDYEAMLKGGMDNDILIMGNSRGKSHFDPYVIDSLCGVSSFCIGIGGYPINAQVAKGYRLHTMSTSNGGSKGFGGGDRIQATLVFERVDLR